MLLLDVASQVDHLLLDKLVECRHGGGYQLMRTPAPRTPWFNTNTNMPIKHTGTCRIAVEVAEDHFVLLHRLLSATNHGLRGWWRLTGRRQIVVMKVRLVVVGKEQMFLVKLPRLCDDVEPLLLTQRVIIQNLHSGWNVRVRLGLGYVIGRALMKQLKKRTWEVDISEKCMAIKRLAEITMASLVAGKREFEVKEVDWTKGLQRLVAKGWGWEGVFNVRGSSAQYARSKRCVVVHLSPAYITSFEETKQMCGGRNK